MNFNFPKHLSIAKAPPYRNIHAELPPGNLRSIVISLVLLTLFGLFIFFVFFLFLRIKFEK